MFQKVYHMYHFIKSLEKVRITNKPTPNPPKDTPAIDSTLGDMMKVTSYLQHV